MGIQVKGVGQLLTAIAAALFVRVITGVGPALPPPEEAMDEDAGDEESPAEGDGGVTPVTIRWSRITCSLSDKHGNTVSN